MRKREAIHARVLELHREGKSVSQIATILAVSTDKVLSVLQTKLHFSRRGNR